MDLRGGEQQRIALARALAGDPEVLLLDEPTTNLDPEASGMVHVILCEIYAEGRTIILAPHDPQGTALASNVYRLENRRLAT